MDIYSEIILDHYKNPRNKGKLKKVTISIAGHNDTCTCDDKIEYDLLIEDDKVSKVGLTGDGCAISQASASMLSEKLIGRTLKEIKKMKDKELLNMLGIKVSPGRINCALLPLNTAKKAVKLVK